MAEKDPTEPITREEYEARHEELRSSYQRYARRSTRILAFLVVVVLAMAGTSGYLLNENSKRTTEIKSTLVNVCKQSGNPLRWAVRQFGETLIGQIQKNIDQSRAFEKAGTFREIFPGYPPGKLHALLVNSREEERSDRQGLRDATDLAKPVPCEERYHAR